MSKRIVIISGGELNEEFVLSVLAEEEKQYVIDAEKFAGKSKNTPFDGREVTGEVKATIVSGEIVYSAE